MDIKSSFFGSGGRISALSEIEGVGGLVSLFVKASMLLAGIILLFYFIMGGIGMISSAGGSDPQKAEQAKKTVTSALIGFIVVFASYWIVKLLGDILKFPIL